MFSSCGCKGLQPSTPITVIEVLIGHLEDAKELRIANLELRICAQFPGLKSFFKFNPQSAIRNPNFPPWNESCLGQRNFRLRSMPVKAVIQRVTKASVRAEERLVSEIGLGLLIFLGVQENDTERELDWLVGKVSRFRIFADDAGAMNRSVQDVGGEILVVSQFTLLADTRKGNRPSFIRAAAPALARESYEEFCLRLEREIGKPVGRGVFGAHMKVSLVNDGPVTICVDTRDSSAG